MLAHERPRRSIGSCQRSPRMKTTRCGTPTFIGIAVGEGPRPEIGTGSPRRPAGNASVTTSPLRLAAIGPQPVSERGPARRRACGGSRSGPRSGCRSHRRSPVHRRSCSSQPGRVPARPARERALRRPTDSPRRQTRASRRRSSSVRFRPSASKTRKSFPPPAIFTNRLGRDMGAGV